MHHFGASDVAELVIVAVEDQERPADGRDLPLDTLCGSHQLYAKGHAQSAMVVQLVVVVRLHLTEDTHTKPNVLFVFQMVWGIVK